jgi:glycosyltransferase involved in cell wall biosynthesis
VKNWCAAATRSSSVPCQRLAATRRRIRVLQFAYGTSLYGAERWVLALARHLDMSKVETIVGCIRDADSPDLPLVDEADRLGFRTLVLDGRRWTVASAIKALRTAIRIHAIDVVHSHGTRQDLIGLLATRSLRCRTLSTPHGWALKASFKWRLYEAANRALFPFFDAVAPLSPGLVHSLRSVPILPARLHPIPNGVDLAEVERAVPHPGLLPGQSSGDEFMIGYAGRLIPHKGLDLLLRALSLLDRAGWHCLIVGDGPSRAELERQARALALEDRVRFLGFRADRLALLKRLDLCVLPSYIEGMPRLLLEALAAGVPCVGSRIPGIVELLEDGVTGTTFRPGDAEGLARAIRLCLADRAIAMRQAQAGRARVCERYSATAMARAYEELYAQLAGVG